MGKKCPFLDDGKCTIQDQTCRPEWYPCEIICKSYSRGIVDASACFAGLCKYRKQYGTVSWCEKKTRYCDLCADHFLGVDDAV